MVISINPISIQIGQSTCVMSLKCIPKSYLKDKTISDLKELCSDLNNVDNSSKGDIVHSSIRENDKIIVSAFNDLRLDSDLFGNPLRDDVKVGANTADDELEVATQTWWLTPLTDYE